MSKGENIFRRKDGRWEARYAKGYQPSGKIIYGFCYGKSYKEAKEKVTKCKAGIIRGIQETTMPKQNLSFFCDEWLRGTRDRVKSATYVKYEAIVEKHIRPRLGSCRPSSLTTGMIEEFTSVLTHENGLSAKTVRDILICLRSILKYIDKQSGVLLQAVEIAYPKEYPKQTRVMSSDEQSRFVSYLMSDIDECRFGILLALLTGMRIGEICALKWGDVDLRCGVVKVSSTMQRLKDIDGDDKQTKILIGSPKSGQSARVISLSEQLADLCGRMKSANDAAYVLTGTERYIEPRTLQYRLKKYTSECGLDGVHFHTLRHTFATRAVEAGFEIKSLSEILGHSTTKITLDKYVHSSLELKRSNMNKLIMLPE